MLNRSQGIFLGIILGVCIFMVFALSLELAEARRSRNEIAWDYSRLLQKEFVGKPNGSLAANEYPKDQLQRIKDDFKATDAYADRIWLQTIGYEVWLGGEVIGERHYMPIGYSYVKATDGRVVVIGNYDEGGTEESYVHLDERKMIDFEANSYFAYELEVHFKDVSYTITSNAITDDTCGFIRGQAGEGAWWTEEDLECGRATPITVKSLLINGKSVYWPDPVALTWSNEGWYSPDPEFTILGVSVKMDAAYFEFMGKNYSINEAGVIRQVTSLDDLVKIQRDEEGQTERLPEA
jgi:hypothetical protein